MTPDIFYNTFHQIRQELAKVYIGQSATVVHLLVAVFSGGHVLLSGMPGLGRTLLVNTLGRVLGLDTRRIQFTPDLLPTDILGTEVLEHDHATGTRNFRFFKGPIFANLVLVDEVNRSPTRTQAALLEVMQERQVTAGGQTFFLPSPFLLIATENSLDSEGVWRLGEAQVDRFMMSIKQLYPAEDEERSIVRQTTGLTVNIAQKVATPEVVLAMQSLARSVPVVPSVRDFALSLTRASRPGEASGKSSLLNFVRLGASPRAAQSLILGAKVLALAHGRTYVTKEDICELTTPVLSHRILFDSRANAEGITFDTLLSEIILSAQSSKLPRQSRWSNAILQ